MIPPLRKGGQGGVGRVWWLGPRRMELDPENAEFAGVMAISTLVVGPYPSLPPPRKGGEDTSLRSVMDWRGFHAGGGALTAACAPSQGGSRGRCAALAGRRVAVEYVGVRSALRPPKRSPHATENAIRVNGG